MPGTIASVSHVILHALEAVVSHLVKRLGLSNAVFPSRPTS